MSRRQSGEAAHAAVLLLHATLARLLSPAARPWHGDLLRAVCAPVVVAAAAAVPGRPVRLLPVLLVAGAYLLLVGAAALGRREDGVPVPGGLLLGLDALHLLWAAGVTAGLGGPVPAMAGAAAACILVRLVLLPPAAPGAPAGLRVPAQHVPSAPGPPPAGHPGRVPAGPQRERLGLAAAQP